VDFVHHASRLPHRFPWNGEAVKPLCPAGYQVPPTHHDVDEALITALIAGDRPYCDTEYNEQQAEAALREVQQLDALCATDRERAAVAALREMLAECAGTPGSYLMFVGD
jgi:hypothetical protein